MPYTKLSHYNKTISPHPIYLSILVREIHKSLLDQVRQGVGTRCDNICAFLAHGISFADSRRYARTSPMTNMVGKRRNGSDIREGVSLRSPIALWATPL